MSCFSSFMRDGFSSGDSAVVAFSEYVHRMDVDGIQQCVNIAFHLEGHLTEQHVPQPR